MNLDKVEKTAGELRGKSFRFAAEVILERKLKWLVETGCYRGGPCDGESTLILGQLARVNVGVLDSYDISEEHIKKAKEHAGHGNVVFTCADSVIALSKRLERIDFAYLDSLDFDTGNPGPAQRHQLAEVGAILGKMSPGSLIMVDDCKLVEGGKNGLSHAFLVDHGWKLVFDDYQRIYDCPEPLPGPPQPKAAQSLIENYRDKMYEV
jgi:hypothetical protein